LAIPVAFVFGGWNVTDLWVESSVVDTKIFSNLGDGRLLIKNYQFGRKTKFQQVLRA
jgi:hypothetical protein